MIEPGHPDLSVVRQCELVSISRSSFYDQPVSETAENLAVMRLIDAQFLETPDGPAPPAGRPRGRPQAGASADGHDGSGADLPTPAHDGAEP